MKRAPNSMWFYASFIKPLIFIVVFAVLFVIILYRINENTKEIQTRNVKTFSENIARKVELKLNGNLDYLNLLAKERAANLLTSETFNLRVNDYLKVHPEFINITWIDSSFIVKNVAPLEDNSLILGLPIELPEPKKASRAARELKIPVYTEAFEAIQSNSSIEVWVPVFSGEKFMGLLAGVYSCENLLKECYSDNENLITRVSLLNKNSDVVAFFPKVYKGTKSVFHIEDLNLPNINLKIKFETLNESPVNWISLLLFFTTIIFVLGFSYSLYKVSVENRLRKEVQADLEKNEITLRKQNQEYLLLNSQYLAQNESLKKAKEKAEESDKLKSSFLANMSHEIRTPMNGILGFADLLNDPNLSGEKQKEYIKIIENGGKRLLNVISEIIDISRIESGQMEVKFKDIELSELFEEISHLFKKEAENKSLELIFTGNSSGFNSVITTDKEKLYSILTNLIKNAIKYTDYGSIEYGYNKEGKNWKFYVRDTGIGIKEDRLEAIFERFVQADITDVQARQGAGLGLCISKAFVEMLGGKIWVESKPSEGSTFYFTLPNLSKNLHEKIEEKTISKEESNQTKKLKILIAEDDETSEMLISMSVENIGKEILMARSGIEAVELSKNNSDIDLILMDIKMPDLNGYEATARIRQFNKNVVIIAQTAFGLTGDREKALQAGCNDYISKPIKKDELLALIQRYC